MAKDSLSKALTHISKTLGIDPNATGGDNIRIRAANEVEDFEYLKLDIPMLDNIFSKNGGIPMGTLMEIFGKHGSGKTYLAQLIAAAAQRQGKNVLFCDVEGAFVPYRAEEVGIKLDDSFIVASNFEYGEKVWDTIHAAMDTKYFNVIIVDSIGAIFSKKELESDDSTKEPQMMVRAKMNKRALGKCLTKMDSEPSSGKNILFVMINHVIATGDLYGPQKQTPGGDGIKYYSHIRCEIAQKNKHDKKAQIYDENGNRIGTKARCIIWKGRMNKPDQEGEFPIYFQEYDAEDVWSTFLSMCQDYEQLRYLRKKFVYPWDFSKKDLDAGKRGIMVDTIDELQDFLVANQDFLIEILTNCKVTNCEEFSQKIVAQIMVQRSAEEAYNANEEFVVLDDGEESEE